MGEKKNSLWDVLFGRSGNKQNSTDDDWSEQCDECGEFFEDCECDCDDEDCRNNGGW